ncbi:phage major capsid protein [Ligilactobacillus pobuzihii]|uniref:phage major capsid protein n=1 Tax=Ligilactobacillus pobuzihii TaxID=449659 RepID=UPI0019D043B3|nr:phage major capsid protein [Ligilactobacillus pobuzihii]MBN7275511.1 phage major capsid protein [Ligilactobacillus pobuzihii]
MKLYQMKQSLFNIGEEIQDVNEKIAEKAASPDPKASGEIQELQKSADSLQVRYDALNKQVKEKEAEQSQKAKPEIDDDPKAKYNHGFAELVRNTIHKEAVGPEIYQALGDENTTGGNKFLPKTVSTDIITEPAVTNPLRDISVVSQIPNLEIPRLTFTLDDDGFIQDKETAKEIQAKGDTVAFGRNKFKVYVGVSETVLLGSDADLTAYVEQGLKNGVTQKEKNVSFSTGETEEPLKHMSFYSAGIKSVTGADLYEAITQAVADLDEAYRDNAQIVMAYKDYLTIIKTLANGSTTLYNAQPEAVLGKPVVFTDAATTPVVGDFAYSQYNYDINTIYDQDKDVKTGINQFVLTAWFDHVIKLNSAFRLAKVKAPKA